MGSATIEGAMVFSEPSFDSDVLTYLRMGQRFRATRGTKNGFHKVKLSNGQIGYMRKEDIRVQGAISSGASQKNILPPREYRDDTSTEDEEDQAPFSFRRFAGPVFGLINYREDLAGQTFQSDINVFGMKFSGPDFILEGPLSDLNVLIGVSAPAYYSQLSLSPPNGFLLMADYRILVPLSETPNRFLYFAGGPVFVYSSYKFELAQASASATQLNMGITLGGGFAYRIKKSLLKVELNSHIEVSRYFSFLLGYQFQF